MKETSGNGQWHIEWFRWHHFVEFSILALLNPSSRTQWVFEWGFGCTKMCKYHKLLLITELILAIIQKPVEFLREPVWCELLVGLQSDIIFAPLYERTSPLLPSTGYSGHFMMPFSC